MSDSQQLRLLALVTVAAASVTAASIFLFLALRSPDNSKVVRQKGNRTYQQQKKPLSPRINILVDSVELVEKEEEEEEDTMSKEVVYLNNPMPCYDYVVGGSEDSDEFEDVKNVVKEIVPAWKQAPEDQISVKIICGGITNRLYRLMWGDQSVLVRLYGENTEAFIDRTVENRVFALLSERGFAPTYYGRFINGRVEGWFDARPLEPEEMGQSSPTNFLSLIGKEIGKMHLMDLPEDTAPALWKKIDVFERLALKVSFTDPVKKSALQQINLSGIQERLLWLKSVLPSSLNQDGKTLVEAVDPNLDAITKQAFAYASDVVFCHNDVLSGNILYNDSWDRVQIIDYEYGAYNFRAFDFANHFCEHCGFDLDLELYPSPEKQFTFFKAYMSTASPALLRTLETNKESKAFFHALYDCVNRYALAAHLFWGYWAVIQAANSKIDFDFLDYAKKRFDAFDRQRDYFFPTTAAQTAQILAPAK